MAGKQDEVPDYLPDDFDDESESKKEEPSDKDGNGEDELVGVKKSDILKLRADALMLFEANLVLNKKNENLVGITSALIRELHKFNDSLNRIADISSVINTHCIEALKKNSVLLGSLYEMNEALNSKVTFQYLKYFLCIVLGSLATFMITMLVSWF